MVATIALDIIYSDKYKLSDLRAPGIKTLAAHHLEQLLHRWRLAPGHALVLIEIVVRIFAPKVRLVYQHVAGELVRVFLKNRDDRVGQDGRLSPIFGLAELVIGRRRRLNQRVRPDRVCRHAFAASYALRCASSLGSTSGLIETGEAKWTLMSMVRAA